MGFAGAKLFKVRLIRGITLKRFKRLAKIKLRRSPVGVAIGFKWLENSLYN